MYFPRQHPCDGSKRDTVGKHESEDEHNADPGLRGVGLPVIRVFACKSSKVRGQFWLNVQTQSRQDVDIPIMAATTMCDVVMPTEPMYNHVFLPSFSNMTRLNNTAINWMTFISPERVNRIS